jgi:hypothetical protein
MLALREEDSRVYAFVSPAFIPADGREWRWDRIYWKELPA